MYMEAFVAAFSFGALLAVSFGPIALLILNSGIQHGKRTALGAASGAATGDFLYAVVGFLIGRWLQSALETHVREINIVASLMLIVLGLVMVFRSLRATGVSSHQSVGIKVGFFSVLALTIINPNTILTFTAYVGSMSQVYSVFVYFLLAVCIGVGSLMVQVMFALGGSAFGRYLRNPLVQQVLQLGSGLGILLFGLFRLF